MALPPAGYPQIRGKRCGADWTASTVVTGQLPGTGFGDQYKHTIQPLTNNYPLIINIGSDRDEQEFYAGKIEGKINTLRKLVAAQKNFTNKERRQVYWLLDRGQEYLDKADDLWTKWADREWGAWPLSQGDNIGDFYGGICSLDERGEWKEIDTPRQKVLILCPAPYTASERPKDRKEIGNAFNDALAHVYCAEYGYWRLRLYKEAFDAYAEPFGFAPGGQPKEPQFTPGIMHPGGLVATPPPFDPCKDYGIGCPPGEEPDKCPSGWCVDPESLPDPNDVDIDIPDPVEPPLPPDLGSGPAPSPDAPGTRRSPSPLPLVAAGAGVLLLTGISFYAFR